MALIHDFAEHRPARAAAQRDLMARIGVRIAFAKGEEIYGEGEEADLIYRVEAGVVRTSRFMVDGRRPVGDFYYPGELFGVETGDDHAMTAEALGACVVLVASRKALRAAGGAEEVAVLILEAAGRELENTRRHLNLLVRKTACERVASFLLDLAARTGGDRTELAMGRQDMADYLGLTIETVSRMVTQLQATLVVEFEGCRRFRIRDRKALEALAAG
jgi:CRP/FNR family nitrogen fixation transcriptional regulator